VTGVTVTGDAAGDFAVTADGCTGNAFPPGATCTVSVVFTPTAAGARSASLVVATTSAAGTHTVALLGTGVITDATPPTLHLPADIVVDALGAAGAAVSYTVTATDAESTVTSIDCSPSSGSLFAIGTTTVSCTATDSRGNTSAPATFDVTVQGGSEQLGDLLADVQGVGPGGSLAAKVRAAQAALAAGDTAGACSALDSFLAEVRAQSGKKLTVAQAQALTADANRIKAVIGC
jgi:HYR domain